jgi:hypothetical protein
MILLDTKNVDPVAFWRKRDHSHSAGSRLKANGTGNELREDKTIRGSLNGNENVVRKMNNTRKRT